MHLAITQDDNRVGLDCRACEHTGGSAICQLTGMHEHFRITSKLSPSQVVKTCSETQLTCSGPRALLCRNSAFWAFMLVTCFLPDTTEQDQCHWGFSELSLAGPLT